MTTTTLSTTPEAAPAATPTGAGKDAAVIRLSAAGLIRSEWIKLRSVRSTVWSYALLVAFSLGLAAIMSASLDLRGADVSMVPAANQATFVAQASTFGVFFGQLIVAVLGVLTISGEYSTGMIRSTLAAVPNRLPALWAKAAVLFVTTFLVGLVSTVGSYLVSSAVLSGKGLHAGLFEPAVLFPVLGGALYLGLIAVFALGIGTIVRSGAGGIAVVLGIVLLVPIVLQMIPAAWATSLLPYLVSNAGINMFGLMSFSQVPIEWWVDLLVVLGWLAASLVGAAVLLKRRDA
ncbi:ABC transporter permease [Cryobacterium algoritolerans]|uniref:ABC transporter permease n=1 Tax=Cryobacterium algoritolerans TaxID=1259184 RepID=A0A4R8WZP8_9MICO|nr:ABC transporter permease [Cryobacterium algoritolerans]TFC19815.1 ABC transporter permease [Cryobacterium algoritolerans]